MRKMREFGSEEQVFIKFCLRTGASNIQIANDLAEMYVIPEDDKNARKKVYKRVQKTKGQMPADEIGSVSIEGSLSDTPQWRKMYLRCLLSRATDEKQKAKILADMRSEDRLIAKSKGHPTTEESDDDVVKKEKMEEHLPWLYTQGECPSIENLPDFNIWEWDGWGMAGLITPKDCHKRTFLPLDEYDFIDPDEGKSEDEIARKYVGIQDAEEWYGYYVRKSDGKKVWADGLPLTPAEEKSGERIEEWEMWGHDGSGGFPRWTIARNEYLRNYYLKRGLEPPPDDVFDTDVYDSLVNRPVGWWHEQRKIKTMEEQLKRAGKDYW